nr:hypothetical protein [Kibdelosporangium sp. MJ126-NF4]
MCAVDQADVEHAQPARLCRSAMAVWCRSSMLSPRRDAPWARYMNVSTASRHDPPPKR